MYPTNNVEPEELEIAHQTLSAVFASTPDGLVVLDNALSIIQANPSFCSWVELGPKEVVGRFIADILPSDELILALHNLVNDECAPTQVELTVVSPVRRVFMAHIAPLRAGRLRGWIVVLHDLSDRRRLDYQKMEFVNIAAHELRTPLMAIIGFANLLLHGMSGKVADRHQEFIKSILDGGRQLKRVVDEMLEFANVNQGYLVEQGVAEFKVLDLINDVTADLQQRALEKCVSIDVNVVDPNLQIFTDTALLRTALNQLVLNGINFNAPNGRVSIAVTQEDYAIVIQITDTGIGIAETDLELIFQPFFQVEDHYIRQVGGLGLGLSIARRAIAQIGGTLMVKSVLEQGTVFTINLPAFQPMANTELASLRAQLEATRQQSRAYARDIQVLYGQIQQHSMATIDTITEVLEARDIYFRSHTERVKEMVLEVARKIGYSEWELRALEVASRIHDIGKIGIPDAIINKAGPLSEEEDEIMRQHVMLGRKIVEPLTFLKESMPIAFSHHERWDGKGYPDGLAGADIPLGGRILAVADAYDAIVSPRSYREALSHEQAMSILRAGAGTQWDPDVVALFVALKHMPGE